MVIGLTLLFARVPAASLTEGLAEGKRPIEIQKSIAIQKQKDYNRVRNR